MRRHPHVFGDVAADDADTVMANWDDIKRDEKQRTSVFDGVARSLPALAYAQHLARKAAKVGFDWPDVAGPLAKVDEELAELREAIAGGDAEQRIADELGDVRRSPSSTSPATPASTPSWRPGPAAAKFRAPVRGRRARWPPSAASTCAAADLDQLDALWDEVKRRSERLSPRAD